MYNFLFTIYLITALLLILVILVQKSPGIAIQAKNTFAGPRSRANMLTRFTGILALCFMGLCLLLTRINLQKYKEQKQLIAQEQAVKK